MIKLLSLYINPFITITEMTNNDGLTNIVQTIADLGVTLVIAAIVVVFLGKYLSTLIDREKSLIDGILPKINELNTSIQDLQKTFNEAIGSHNTRSNQSLRTLERDANDIKKCISEDEEILRDIFNKMMVLENNYDTLLKILVSLMNSKNTGMYPSHRLQDIDVILEDKEKDE